MDYWELRDQESIKDDYKYSFNPNLVLAPIKGEVLYIGSGTDLSGTGLFASKKGRVTCLDIKEKPMIDYPRKMIIADFTKPIKIGSYDTIICTECGDIIEKNPKGLKQLIKNVKNHLKKDGVAIFENDNQELINAIKKEFKTKEIGDKLKILICKV